MGLACGNCSHVNRDGARFCQGCGSSLALACAGCGNEMSPEARFCDACGQAADAAAAPSSTSRHPSAGTDSSSSSSERRPGSSMHPVDGDVLCDGRYRIERFLGEGARKRVYLARDQRLDRSIALAVVPSEGLDLIRLRREAEAMGRLGDHPHIVTVYDVIEEDGRVLMICQHMEGGDLNDFLSKSEGRRLSFEDALRIADEMADALSHAHGRGIVHRDLKPGNVWFAADGSARLGDFGLAVSTDKTRITQEGSIVGTAAYMPPEQAVGGAVTPQSDLYSLGAMLYEMFTGRPPFIGEDSVGVISQHLNATPVAPSWHNPQVTPEAEELVMSLLEKDVAARPANAESTRARISKILSTPAPATPEIAAIARLDKSHFVGREDELRAVHRAIDRSLGSTGSILVVAGEPGIGKTFLATQAATYAGLRGAKIASGFSHEGEGGIAYLPFVEVLRSHIRSMASADVVSTLGASASDLVDLLPDLREFFPGLEASPARGAEEDRFRLFDTISNFLIDSAQTQPLVILLEDLHWADHGSLLLLEHLSRRLSTSRVLVIGTYRDVELDRTHPLAATLGQLRRTPGFERIALRGLGQNEVLQVFQRMVHGEELDENASKLAELVYRETEGNPFFVDAVVRNLAESGAIERLDGRWVTRVDAAIELGIPEGVREAIGRRLTSLSDTANQVLANAAILGREFEFAVLQAMSELSEDELLDAIDEAVERHMVEESGSARVPTYRFSHALVRQSLSDELSLVRRQRAHFRAAQAIEFVHAQEIEPYVVQLARLYRESGSSADPHAARDYAMRAGNMSARVLAWEEAADQYGHALDAWGDGDLLEKAELLERVGDVLYNSASNKDAAVEGLEEALQIYEELGNREKVGHLHGQLARSHSFPGFHVDITQAIHHGQKAEEILLESPPAMGLVVTRTLLAAALQCAGRTDDAFQKIDAAYEVCDALDSDLLRTVTDIVWCSTAGFNGQLREAQVRSERCWKHASEINLGPLLGAAISTMSVRWTVLDLKSFAALEEGMHLIPKELVSQRNLALNSLAQNLAHAGRIDELREILPQVKEQGFGEVHAWLYEDWNRADEIQKRSGEIMRRTGNLGHLTWHARTRGQIAMLKGDLARAKELHHEALEMAVKCKGVREELRLRTDLVLIAARTGEFDEATPHFERAIELVSNGEDWGGMPGVIAKLRGALAAANGRMAEATPHFESALAIFREFKVPFEVAEVYFVWGEFLLDENNKTEALHKFNSALSIYRKVHASNQWIERVIAVKMRAQGSGSSGALQSIAAVAANFDSRRPDLSSMAAGDGHITLMFSDLADFTKMTEKLGDQEAHRIMSVHNGMVREICHAHDGTEVELRGDGFLLAFADSGAGMRCAIDLQRSFTRYNESHPELPLHLRIGLHEGEAIRDEDKFFGKTVIQAFRIADLAEGGEILLSEDILMLGREQPDLRFGASRTVELKGIQAPQEITSLEWK